MVLFAFGVFLPRPSCLLQYEAQHMCFICFLAQNSLLDRLLSPVFSEPYNYQLFISGKRFLQILYICISALCSRHQYVSCYPRGHSSGARDTCKTGTCWSNIAPLFYQWPIYIQWMLAAHVFKNMKEKTQFLNLKKLFLFLHFSLLLFHLIVLLWTLAWYPLSLSMQMSLFEAWRCRFWVNWHMCVCFCAFVRSWRRCW